MKRKPPPRVRDPRLDPRLNPPWLPPGWMTPKDRPQPPYPLYDPPPGYFRWPNQFAGYGGWGSAIRGMGAALPRDYPHGGFGLKNLPPPPPIRRRA